MTNSYNYVTPNIVITDISVPPESSVFPRHPLLRGLWLSLPAALVTCEFFLILNKVDQNNKHAKYCRHDPLSSVSSFVCLDFETGSPFLTQAGLKLKTLLPQSPSVWGTMPAYG